ncbi:MAG: hypothetical protein Q9160_005640 [Pyrenula sp. 1 TL-2023]
MSIDQSAVNTHTAIDKGVHRRKRKLVSQAFSEQALRRFEPVILEQVTIFLNHLSEAVGQSTSNIGGEDEPLKGGQKSWSSPIDLGIRFKYLTVDVLGEFGFGQSLDLQTSPKNRFFIDAVDAASFRGGIYAQYAKLRKYGFDLIILPLKKGLWSRFIRLNVELVTARLKNPKAEKTDLFSFLADAKDPESGEGTSPEELFAESALFTIAGTDTTATALSATLFYLSRHPECYDRLVSDIRSAFKHPSEIKTGSELTRLTYLRACIDEAMRISPPVGAALWREVCSADGANIRGVVVPRGMEVGASIYSVHHDEEVFTDPFTYIPQRWMAGEGSTPEQLESMKWSFQPFSVGSRSCVAKNMAYLELSITIARLLWYFDVRVSDTQKDMKSGDREEQFELKERLTANGNWPAAAPEDERGEGRSAEEDAKISWPHSAHRKFNHGSEGHSNDNQRLKANMPGPSNTLLIEGSFSELAEELAQYIDTLNKTDENSGIAAEIKPVLTEIRQAESAESPPDDAQISKQRENVLKVLVGNGAYISEPIKSSPQLGPALQVTILTTLFNTIPQSNQSRYHVFLALLQVIRSTSQAAAFEALTSQLVTNIPKWLASWDLDSDDVESLYIAIADVAQASGDAAMSYDYLLKALGTIPATSASESESLQLAKRALTAALSNPHIYDFTPLTASDSIQALRKSDPTLFELLEIFASDDYSSYIDFLETNSLESISLASVASILDTKIRLLTIASLAASAPNRSLPYSMISSSLQIPQEDVEVWVIDTIRAGLVEGKLSQLKGEFLVQRATYRVFGEKQWSEIQGRLLVWRRSLEGVLGVIRSEKERFAREGAGGQEVQTNGYGGERRQGRGARGAQRDMDFGTD